METVNEKAEATRIPYFEETLDALTLFTSPIIIDGELYISFEKTVDFLKQNKEWKEKQQPQPINNDMHNIRTGEQPKAEFVNRKRFSKIAKEVEQDMQVCGLTNGIYEDFAYEIHKRITEPKEAQQPKASLEGIEETIELRNDEEAKYLPSRLDFYRAEMKKLREYINSKNIGKPNQSFFDVMYDYIKELEEAQQPKADAGIRWVQLNDRLPKKLGWYICRSTLSNVIHNVLFSPVVDTISRFENEMGYNKEYLEWLDESETGETQEVKMREAWISVVDDTPPICTVVLGYNEKWIDEDFEPEGIRECFLHDYVEGDTLQWSSCVWNNDGDFWMTDDNTEPTHWMRRPEPPVKTQSTNPTSPDNA